MYDQDRIRAYVAYLQGGVLSECLATLQCSYRASQRFLCFDETAAYTAKVWNRIIPHQINHFLSRWSNLTHQFLLEYHSTRHIYLV